MKLNRRSILLLAGCIVILSVLTGLIFTQQREPRYEGRSLSSWLEDASPWTVAMKKDPMHPPSVASLEQAAANAVRQMGPEAYPFLLEMLKAKDGPVRKTVLQKLGQRRAMKLGLVPAEEKQSRARAILYRLGTNAAVVWKHVLLDTSLPQDVRLAGSSWFEALPAEAPQVIPVMLRLMADIRQDQRDIVRWGIGRFGVDPALPVLEKQLQEPDRKIQLMAMRAIKYFGSKAKLAIPALDQQLKSSDDEVGLAAADTLSGLDAHYVPAIVYRMHHGELGMRVGAYWMLTREEEDGAKAVPELVRGLTDPEPQIRQAAAEALAKYEVAARSALPGLTNLFNDQKRFVRVAATNAVERIQGTKEGKGM